MPIAPVNLPEIDDWECDSNEEDEEECKSKNAEPQTFSQSELNDLIRDLYLTKEGSKLLGSTLKDKNLVEAGTTFSSILFGICGLGVLQ